MWERRRRLAEIAESQLGVVLRAQLVQLGFSEGSVDQWVRFKRLIPVASGVYRVPGAPQSAAMAIRAAVLGSGGHASGTTAASLMQLQVPRPLAPLQVAVVADGSHPRLTRVRVEDDRHSFFGVKVRRFQALGAPIIFDGVPCTDVARTLIDLAGQLSEEELAAAVDRARDLRLVSLHSLGRSFARLGGRGRPGTPKLRKVLETASRSPMQSKLENRAWDLIAASGLPLPERQHVVRVGDVDYRLDFAWPEWFFTFETEGFEWHGTRARWKEDRIRVGGIERLGWRHMIGSWDDVVKRPDETLERLVLVLAERRALFGHRAS